MSDVRFPMQPLSDLAVAIKDGTHGTHRRVAEGVPLLSAKNITANGDIAFDESDDLISEAEYQDLIRPFRLEPGDLLLTIVGSLGRRATYCGQRIAFQRSVAYVRPQQRKLRGRFLFHWMGHPAFSAELVRRSNATAQAGLYLGELAKVSVPVPDGPEQSEIAQILDTLDIAIHETEAIIAKLKAVKQGLLHDLLTRGIDANGELRPPQAEAPHLYKRSPLGWIPKEWDVRSVHQMGEVVTGSTPPSHDPLAWGPGVPFVTPGDIDEDRPTSMTERYVSGQGQRYVRLLPTGSTVVVCIGSTIGKIGITSTTVCTNQQINAVVPVDGTDHAFLFYTLQMHSGQLRALAGLQAVPIVNKSSFESIGLPCPPSSEQAEIGNRVLAVSDRLLSEQKLSQKLRRQKLGLMDDLLTGRVRVTSLLAEAGQQEAST